MNLSSVDERAVRDDLLPLLALSRLPESAAQWVVGTRPTMTVEGVATVVPDDCNGSHASKFPRWSVHLYARSTTTSRP
jgi:hypothetical protein